MISVDVKAECPSAQIKSRLEEHYGRTGTWMFGRSRGLDVGWWVSFDNCDLHHPLHPARSCEVLNGSDGARTSLSAKRRRRSTLFALRAHAGRDALAPERASS